MRAARAASARSKLAEEERRAARSKARDEARRAAKATVAESEPPGSASADRASSCDPRVVHAECRATIRKLQMIIDKMGDDRSDLILDRWMLKERYDFAIGRMEKHDPEGPAWLDNHLRD